MKIVSKAVKNVAKPCGSTHTHTHKYSYQQCKLLTRQYISIFCQTKRQQFIKGIIQGRNKILYKSRLS